MIWRALLIIAGTAMVASDRIMRRQLEPNPFIVNGTDAKIEDFPFAVSVQYKSYHICGGSILSEYWVLTVSEALCKGSIRALSNYFATKKS